MIEINNISKSFRDKKVLFKISGKFEKGKTNLIIGSSGTWKSVLLKCLVGLLKPDKGSVLFDGRDFTNANKNLTTEIRREIGMLFQGSALFDSKNVEENIKSFNSLTLVFKICLLSPSQSFLPLCKNIMYSPISTTEFIS